MSRPIKRGVPYFSFDTDFFGDEKIRMIKGEFGNKGIVVFIALLCDIYGGEGYYKAFGEVQCALLAEKLGNEATPGFINEVVNGCFRRGLFDKAVFDMFGVLTSAGIQRRYLRAACKREQINLMEEYWLLDNANPEDVPPSILIKVAFKNISGTRNPQKVYGNKEKDTRNTQSKVKQSKVKNRKETPPPDKTTAPKKQVYGEFGNVLLLEEEHSKLVAALGDKGADDYIERVSAYVAQSGKAYKSHYATILNWWRKDGEPVEQSAPRPQFALQLPKPAASVPLTDDTDLAALL